LALVFLLVSKSNRGVQVNNKIEYGYTSEITIKGIGLNVEIVRTSEAQAQGLSGRASLEKNAGMLFDFEKPDVYKFWMKDMKFPIDIIWINKEGEVIYIQKNTTPESYPESFGPEQSVKYVLEVVAGFADKNNIKIGDKLVL